jgi:hypothetical protein
LFKGRRIVAANQDRKNETRPADKNVFSPTVNFMAYSRFVDRLGKPLFSCASPSRLALTRRLLVGRRLLRGRRLLVGRRLLMRKPVANSHSNPQPRPTRQDQPEAQARDESTWLLRLYFFPAAPKIVADSAVEKHPELNLMQIRQIPSKL